MDAKPEGRKTVLGKNEIYIKKYNCSHLRVISSTYDMYLQVYMPKHFRNRAHLSNVCAKKALTVLSKQEGYKKSKITKVAPSHTHSFSIEKVNRQ